MRNQQRRFRLGVSLLAIFVLSAAVLAQTSPDRQNAAPVISDWSQNHVVFSKPANAERARLLEQDFRYRQQQMRMSTKSTQQINHAVGAEFERATSAGKKKLKRDWAENMNSGASVGAGNYPAKFSFSITTASCASAPQPDFVVYGTGLAGSSTQASIIAYDNLYSGCNLLNLGTAANFAILASSTITNAGASVVTGADIGISPGTSLTGFPPGVLTAPAAQHLGDAVAAQAQADANTAYTFYQGLTGATLIAPVLDGLTFTPGLYKAASSLALSAGATVTLNGNGTYVFQIGSTLEIAGTVVLSGGATAGNVIWLVGSSATLDGTGAAAGDIIAQASITLDSGASLAGRAIALAGAVTMIDNAVTTVDTVPSVYWAYNTAGGTVTTSPVLSLDGTQVAFVQTDSSGNATLVLLKWAASSSETVSSPMTLSRVTNTQYPTCTTPCMTTEPLTDSGGNPNADTGSSVFYVYGLDVAFVGDDAGWLHKITGVFNGVPAEVGSAGWPVQVNPLLPTPLSSPAYDPTSGLAFVSDRGGLLYRVGPNTAFVAASGQLDFSKSLDGGPGMLDGPAVDPSAELVYAFATSDGSASCPGGSACSAVYALAANFPAGNTGQKAIVGASSISPAKPNPLYLAGFDTTYRTSVNATGNLYVCGNTGGPPILYRVPIAGSSLSGFGTAGPVLASSGSPACSPVTDFTNPNVSGGPTERIFMSVQNLGASSSCASGGCIFNFKNTPWQSSTAYAVGQEVLDSHFQLQVVSVAGTSGTSVPNWTAIIGDTTSDGSVQWLNQGPESAFTPAAWQASHGYAPNLKILDANNNVQLVTAPGTSGGTIPTFSTTAGGVTNDGSSGLQWTNVGALGTAALPVSGGASAVIIDNTVTSAGGSQVYFSTLGNQPCGTSGAGGCAIQASQAGLK